MRSGLASTWKTLTNNLGLGFQLLASRKRMLYVGTLPMSLKQWDQIVWLFVQYLAIYYFENLHNTAKVGSKLWQIINKLSNKLPNTFKILPKWQNFAISGHTGLETKYPKVFSSKNSYLKRRIRKKSVLAFWIVSNSAKLKKQIKTKNVVLTLTIYL